MNQEPEKRKEQENSERAEEQASVSRDREALQEPAHPESADAETTPEKSEAVPTAPEAGKSAQEPSDWKYGPLANQPTDWAALAGEKPKKPFVRTWQDRVFALAFYLVGYVYVTRVLDCAHRWYLAAFTLFYAAAVLGYFFFKGIRPKPFSWFWLAVLLSVGGSFALYENASLLDFDLLILHGVAMYWPLCAAGATLRPATSSTLPWDLLNAFVISPFGNFFSQIRCLFGGWNFHREGAGKWVGAAALGVGILAALLLLVTPLLIRADEQFAQLVRRLEEIVTFRWDGNIWPFLWALPVGFYLFGHAYGCANRRHTDHIVPERLGEWSEDVRVLPAMTVHIALAGVCLVYAVFIVVQAPSLFSAFAGRLHGTEIYSEFAREGFFELCRVAAINGLILLGADLLCASPRQKNRILRLFNLVMAALTLLILASAAGKMLLYIQVYGLTPKRVLTMAFMAMLAVLFGGIAVRQFRKFNLIRLAVVFAAVLFCILTLCNLDHWIEAFNLARSISM
jgi:hypothetical protein